MRKFKVRKQIRNLYFITAIGSLQIAGASWVALLALRGFSIVQIGTLESIFHVVSMCFEIPSGVVADVFGRRKTMIISQYLTLISIEFQLYMNYVYMMFLVIFLELQVNMLMKLISHLLQALLFKHIKFVLT